MNGFIKLNRSKELEEVLRYYPGSFLLLTLIAVRARRSDDRLNPHGLEIGEALIGDYAAVGMKRQAYRTALQKLVDLEIVSARGTNKGTVAKLLTSEIYDINAEVQQPTEKPATTPTKQPSEQLSIGGAETTKKKGRKEEPKNEEERRAIAQIIDYLNDKSGRDFRATTKIYIKTIRARFAEGYKLEDFLRVVDVKVAKWKDDEKMKDYLRPETLFAASHFESYRNEEEKKEGPSLLTSASDLRELMGKDPNAYNEMIRRLIEAGFRPVYNKGAGNKEVLYYYADASKAATVQKAENAGYMVVRNDDGTIRKFVQR